ncbi:MAG: hypothetical protein ACE5G5_10525 [Candidatus Methylomirabilales bacterium]
MRLHDPLPEGFCWDHGFYSALSCPRCSKGGFTNGVEEKNKGSEDYDDLPLFYLFEQKQFVHDD